MNAEDAAAGTKPDVEWRSLALLETGGTIRQAINEWQDVLSKQSAGQRMEYISRTAMLNDRTVVICPARNADTGTVLFCGKLVSKCQEALAREMLNAPMPPRPRTWACTTKAGEIIRLVCLPFEGDDPRIVVLFDD
jgi:hypothetical protein